MCVCEHDFSELCVKTCLRSLFGIGNRRRPMIMWRLKIKNIFQKRKICKNQILQ